LKHEHDCSGDKWDQDHYLEQNQERDSKPIASHKNLMEEVISQDKERNMAKGRSYSSGPPTVKANLSSAGSEYRNKPVTSPHHSHGWAPLNDRLSSSHVDKKPDTKPKRKTAEEIAAVQQKKQKLMAKYS
jgi:hypothetical protein